MSDENFNHESYTFKEAQPYVEPEINIEELLKIDFKKIFHKQPSQVVLGREEGDMRLTTELIKSRPAEEETSKEEKLLNRKTSRAETPEVEEKKVKLIEE